jgi:DNA gyrase subunit B
MAKQEYTGNDIDILEGLEAVRKRPGMYIGNTSTKGLHHCIWEVLDNGVDESLAGECDLITLTLHKDETISIEDNGRGIPIDMHPKAKIPTVRVVYTILHAGGKFKEGAYKVAGGLHGVGASVVNALSDYLEVEVYKNGKIYYDRYEKGKPVVELDSKGNLKPIGKTDKPHGTKVTFKPDETIFETTTFNDETIREHLKQTCYLNSHLTIAYENEILGTKETFHFENGLIDFMKELTENEDTTCLSDIAYFKGSCDNMEAEICLRLIEDQGEKCFSFVNNITTPDDGTHVTGFRGGLTKCINSYSKDFGLKEPLQGNDIRNGLVYIISFKMPDPQFEGQTKGKLGSSSAKSGMEAIVSSEGPLFFDRNYKILDSIIQNALKNQKERKKIEDSKSVALPKNQFEVSNKLADCNETRTNPQNCEIFIVEGDSAGGTAKTARSRATQAILPLRGKHFASTPLTQKLMGVRN